MTRLHHFPSLMKHGPMSSAVQYLKTILCTVGILCMVCLKYLSNFLTVTAEKPVWTLTLLQLEVENSVLFFLNISLYYKNNTCSF